MDLFDISLVRHQKFFFVFFTVIIGSHVVVLSFTGFYLVFFWFLSSWNWCLPSCTGFYLVLIGSYLVVLDFKQFNWVLLGFT